MALIPLLFFGDKIFNAMGMQIPAWHVWLTENKMMAIGASFLLSTMSSRLGATGAFEVYLYDTSITETTTESSLPAGWSQIFSALASEGRAPHPTLLLGLLRRLGVCPLEGAPLAEF